MEKQKHEYDSSSNSSEDEVPDFEVKAFDQQKKSALQSFDCGQVDLNRYAKQQLSQDAKKGLSVPYILEQSGELAGFYTLSNASVDAGEYLKVANGVGKFLPVPVTLIGRLAVDSKYQGVGYGGILLMDALENSLKAASVVASKAVIVDPIDDSAVNFYKNYGFMEIPGTKRMMLTMDEVRKLI